ncbi:putative glycoside hydrolase [Methylomonas sp. MgM2]
MNKTSQIVITILLLINPINALSLSTLNNKFINTFLIYLGGGKKLTPMDSIPVSNFDLIVVDRFRYKNITDNTWTTLKAHNKDLAILLYQNGPQVSDNTDHLSPYYLNNIGRLNTINSSNSDSIDKHEDWFLVNKVGMRLRSTVNYHSYQLDFGNPEFQQFWLNATSADIINRPWKADGLMIDNCATFNTSTLKKMLYVQSEKYPDASSWDIALNQFLAKVTEELHSKGQLVMPNRTNSRLSTGEKAWIELDKSKNPPDIVFDEGAFVVSWGRGDAQFFPIEDWLRQINLPEKIHNSSIAYLSHTDLNENESGYDSKGNSVNFNQILQYALGSYLLAKRSTPPFTLFGFDYNRQNGDYKRISWLNIYKNFDFGKPLGKNKNISINIYAREFERGFVFVNPTSEKNDIDHHPDYRSIIKLNPNGTIAEESLTNKDKITIEPHSSLFISKIHK